MSVLEILASRKIVSLPDGRTRELSLCVADALCMLVREGGELGELELQTYRRENGDVGQRRVMPATWLPRLQRAAEVGAFERLSIDEIVVRILGPAPGAEA